MATIGERIFVLGGSKKYVSLANEEIVRYIGTDWTSIRIGLLVALNTDGTNNISGRLGIGVCAGDTNPLMNPTSTDLFVGHRTLSGSSTWTYNANSGNPYFSQSAFYGLRREGTTDTTAGVGNTTHYITTVDGGSIQRRSLIFLDLDKSGTTQPFSNATTQFGIDLDYAALVEGLEYPSTSLRVQDNLLQAQASQSLGFGTPESLDHIDIAWSGVDQALEIYALGVWRKS